MAYVNPFSPSGASGTITTSGASSSVTLSADGVKAKVLHLVNFGANHCFVRFGKGAQTAVATDMVVRTGETVNIWKGEGADTVAALQSTGATSLQVTPGEGGV